MYLKKSSIKLQYIFLSVQYLFVCIYMDTNAEHTHAAFFLRYLYSNEHLNIFKILKRDISRFVFHCSLSLSLFASAFFVSVLRKQQVHIGTLLHSHSSLPKYPCTHNKHTPEETRRTHLRVQFERIQKQHHRPFPFSQEVKFINRICIHFHTILHHMGNGRTGKDCNETNAMPTKLIRHSLGSID